MDMKHNYVTVTPDEQTPAKYCLQSIATESGISALVISSSSYTIIFLSRFSLLFTSIFYKFPLIDILKTLGLPHDGIASAPTEPLPYRFP